MASPDGHCRAFDKNAQGTIFGSGAGIVVLKKHKLLFEMATIFTQSSRAPQSTMTDP